MPYPEHSIAKRLLDEDPEALGQVLRWISTTLTWPRYWSLKEEWPDLAQDVLTRVVESLRLGRFDETRDLRVYVQGITRYALLQALARRVQMSSRSTLDLIPDRSSASPEERVVDRQLVRRILDLASEECRELIRLYFFESSSYDEIAALMEVPVGTVKSRLFRCVESAHLAVGLGAARHRRNRES